MGVLGGVFVLKSGLRILIWAPQVPFSVPPKTPKMGVFGYFGDTENGTIFCIESIVSDLGGAKLHLDFICQNCSAFIIESVFYHVPKN